MKAGSNTVAGPLEGTWSVTGLEVDGQTMAAGLLSGAHIVVTGDRFQSLGMGSVYEGVVKLDPSANPKTIDMIFDKGPEKGNTSLGIYELEGDDWRLCMTMRGGPRPTRFATQPGTGIALETLRRGEAAPAPTPVAEPEEPASADSGVQTELEGVWSMVSGFMDGHPIDRNMLKYGQRVTRGNTTTVSFGPQVYMKATFVTDEIASPKTIDLTHTQGSHKGKTQFGLYERAGDVLRLSLATPGSPRPTDFSSKEGDGRTVAEWKKKA